MGILDKIIGGNTLYYPGCLTKFVMKNIMENYEKILRKCGIDFIKLKDQEVCCGSPSHNAGYKIDFITLANKNFDVFKKHSIRKIITSCPACYKTLKYDYKKILGDEWKIDVEHVTQTILNSINSGKLKFNKVREKFVTYHDPCHLGRHSGIYEEPRKIIELLGYKIVEMKFNRNQSLCCGGGGGLSSNYPELSQTITKDVLEEALKTKTQILVTTCPMCDASFLKVLGNSKIEIKELSELVVERLI
ncbi:MAG: (Fe-S)-binding protein [Candidatus Aenigmatarchaeota archaeon]